MRMTILAQKNWGNKYQVLVDTLPAFDCLALSDPPWPSLWFPPKNNKHVKQVRDEEKIDT